MKLIASDSNMREISYKGKVTKRGKDATFTVPDSMGKSMKKGSEFAVVGTNFQSARGFVCRDCSRVNVFKGRCGKCGSSKLKPEA